MYLNQFWAATPAEGFAYWINVYQEGAKFFGEPVRCNMEGC